MTEAPAATPAPRPDRRRLPGDAVWIDAVLTTIVIATANAARRPWLGPPLLVGSTLLFAVCLTLFVTGQWAF